MSLEGSSVCSFRAIRRLMLLAALAMTLIAVRLLVVGLLARLLVA